MRRSGIFVAALALTASGIGTTLGAKDARADDRPAEPMDQAAHDAAYERWFGRRPVHGGRIALESLGVLVVGTTYYWADPLANEEDWDDPAVVDKLRLRAASFDTNLNSTNHLLHPSAGAFTYGLARDNGLSVPAAFALTGASSIVWELGLEWREKASYNDLVYTTFGGVVVGNFFHRLGEYVNSAPAAGNVPRLVASWLFGAPRHFHAALDHEERPAGVGIDDLGWSSAFAHRFRVGYEIAALSNDAGGAGAMHRIALSGELAAMPGMLHAGTFSRRFGDANFTSLAVKVGFGSRATDDEADISGIVTLAGEYAQSFTDDDRGGLHGHATMIGFGPGWRFQTSEWLGRRDQLSMIHLLGPHVTTWLADGPLRARVDGAAHADFASIRSLAYEIYPNPSDETHIKGVLERQGYTYDLGWSARASGEIGLGPVALHGAISYGRYGSIEGLDRRQSLITTEIHGTEDVLETSASLRVHLSHVELGVGGAERRRNSTLGKLDVSRWDRSLGVSAGLVF